MDKNVRKIAVVGDPATVLGFRGLGFETWPIPVKRCLPS